MTRYFLHAVKVLIVGLSIAYLGTYYLFEPMGEQIRNISIGILVIVVLADLLGKRIKRLSH